MAQFARPDADQATGTWTTTPLWSKVEEGPTGDDITITSADNTAPDNADLRLSDVSDPSVATGHIIRAQWNKSGAGGHSINAVCELWQGIPDTGTLRATLSVTAISESPTDSSYTLSAAEANSITDYTDLYFRVSRQGDTGGPPGDRRSLIVDFVELEVPDAGTSGTGTANGTSTATGTGRADARAPGSAAGTGTATGTGRSDARGDGSSAATGAATATGRSDARGAGTAAGIGTATAVSGDVSSVGSAAGTGTATATGRADARADGSSAGTGAATATGTSTARTDGTAAGTGAATAAGLALQFFTGDTVTANRPGVIYARAG